MKQFIFASLLTFAICVVATASEASRKEAEKGISNVSSCLKSNDKESCKSVITSNSVELFNRFNGYGLFSCLPSNLDYFADHMQGGHMVVKSIINTPDERQYLVRLAFLKEGSDWKLDVPKSLEVGLGTEWKQKLDAGEKIYLLLRQQYGEQLSCNMLQGVVKR